MARILLADADDRLRRTIAKALTADGHTVAELDQYPRPGAIVISDRPDVNLRAKCLDDGADDYMVKPLRMDDLVGRVSAALRLRELRAERRLHTDEVITKRA